VKRNARHIGLALLGAAGLLLIALYLVIGTTAGSRWLLQRLLAQSPIPISISAIEGRLSDRLILHDIHSSWDDNKIEIDELTLAWSPWPLFSRNVKIERLAITSLTLHLATSTDAGASTPQPLVWPALPGWLESWQLQLDSLDIGEIRLQRPSSDDLTVDHITAAIRLQNGLMVIDNLRGSSAGHRIESELEIGLLAPRLKTLLKIGTADGLETASLDLDLAGGEKERLLTGPIQGVITPSGDEEYRLAAMLNLTQDRLELTDLRIERPATTGMATGQLGLDWSGKTLQAGADLSLQNWVLLANAETPLTVDGHLNGTGNRDSHNGRFDLTLAGEVLQTGRLAGDWTGEQETLLVTIEQGRWLGGDISGTVNSTWGDQAEATLKLNARRLDPALLAADWTGSVNLAADITVVHTAEDTSVQFDAAFADSLLRGVPLRGATKGRWQDGALELDLLDLRGGGFAVQAHGSLAERLSLNLAIDNLGGLIPQATGNLFGQGWLGYREGEWLADITAKGDRLHLGKLSFDAARLTLHRPETTAPIALHLEAGEAGFDTILFKKLQATLTGDQENHALTISAELPGGAVHATGSGQRTTSGWQGTVSELLLSERNAGAWELVDPVAIQIGDDTLNLGSLHLRGQSGEFTVSGDFSRDGDPRRLEVTIERFPLKSINPLLAPWRLAGDLDATLACAGQSCRLQASGLEAIERDDQSLPLEDVHIDGLWASNGLQAEFAVNLGEAGHLKGTLSSAVPLRWQLPEEGKLSLSLKQFNPEPLLNFTGTAPLRGALSGEFNTDWHNNRPERIFLDIVGPLDWLDPARKPLSLELALRGDWQKTGLNLTGRADAALGGQLILRATSAAAPQWTLPAPIDWTASWSALPLLGHLTPPQPLTVTGTWSGNAEGTFDSPIFRSSGRADAVDARLTWQNEDSGEIIVNLDETMLTWRWLGDELKGDLAIGLADRGQLAAQWQLPIPARWPITPTPQGVLHGQLTGRLKETGLFGLLLPETIQDTHGELKIDAALSGLWAEPALSGTAQLRKGSAYIPAPGLRLEEIGLDVQFEGEQIHFSNFTVLSAPGRLTGEGTITLQEWRPKSFELAVRGENVTLAHLPELQIEASPNLKLTGTPEKMSLTGEILIPSFLAEARSERNPVAVSRDVIVIDAERPPEEQLAVKLSTRIRLILGDQVLIKMFGLDARLGGQLDLTGIDQQHFSGQGEVHIKEGTYSTYGVKLKIEKGRAVYAGGPLDNPAIDILALKIVGDVRAGVQVRGTAKVPEAKLYAEPAMADTDILSYIVLGRPLSQAGSEADPLMLAAGALLSAGDSALLRSRLQSQLGIDTLEAESVSGQTTDTILRLGKYLTPDIYLSYGYALFGQQSEVGLRYRFHKSWEAESKFGLESGADLYYRFEFE
jgi:translocation and assembly module TamB